MLNTIQLTAFCERHQLSQQARQVIDHVRASPPTRRVQSGAHNVSCHFASQKMGMVIQAESHKNELPAVIGWEHDAKTHEFYDQPPKIKLSYVGRNGKRVTHLATPDYFLIQEGFTGWVECKTEEWLQARATEGLTLYTRNSDDTWRCPAGEQYAATVGLQFQVRSSAATSWITIRNLEFLTDYLDERCPAPNPEAIQRVWNAVTEHPWLPLKNLLDGLAIEDADVVFKMIADKTLCVRLDQDLLSEPERTIVFRDQVTADAYKLHLASQAQPTLPTIQTLTVAPGQSLLWDGRVWRILNVGNEDVFLEDEERVITSVRRKIFEQMVKDTVITGIPIGATTDRDLAEEIVRRSSPQDFEGAMFRYRCLFPERFDEPAPKSCARARRKWRALYNRGQELYGSGLLGLIPKTSQRGNRERRLDEAIINIMDEVIDTLYAKENGWSISICSGEITNRCNAAGLLPPSEVAFRDQIKRRNQNILVVAREGKKAAYSNSEFYWRLDQSTPRHGERPFEFGHCDHTELDLQFRGARKGEKMGKAWLSVLLDAYTRVVLAWVILFDAPSYRSCMALIRECIRRHGRIPKTIIVDKGPEFKSIYFETLLARVNSNKKTRPGSKPRFGSIIERFFGMNNELFIHNLRGNNVALQKPRQMSKSHDPRELSVWTLPEFNKAFEVFIDKIYGEMEHPALGMSPKEALAVGLAQSGLRRHVLIPNTREMTIMCLPSTPKGTAKIDASRGIKLGYIFYWSPAFRNPKLAGTNVPVRYDPYDKSVAIAWLKNHWEPCQSEFANIFRGRSEKEIAIVTQEITAQNKRTGVRRTINAALIAKHLTSTTVTEDTLRQRLRDNETRPIDHTPQSMAPSNSDLQSLEDAIWGDLETQKFGE